VPEQFSATSHTSAALRHTQVVVLNWSVGHPAALPGHNSASSQEPEAERHTVAAEANPSTGQLTPLPVHRSSASQGPAATRQVVVDDAKASVGQLVDVPVQLSAASHTPAAARHTAAALPAGCLQSVAVPLHWSRLHGFPSLVHTVPLALTVSAGQVVEVPVHDSVRSHSSAATLHVVPAKPAGCWQALLEPSHWSTEQGFPSLVQPAPAARFESPGQLAELPVQVSARSQSPAEARHVVPALPAAC
jgi:hypothetical protein